MSRLLDKIRSPRSESPKSDDPLENSILEALRPTRWKLSRLERISGGNANFTYRGTLKKPDKDSYDTIIIKHAEPFVALNQEWKIDVGRSVCQSSCCGSVSIID
jgi:5-methylthioribose kinase